MLRSPALMFLSLLISPISLAAQTQSCGSKAADGIATDRPQITNSSVVVPCGSLQFENGFAVSSTGGQRTLDLPETSIRFGIAPKTELRLATPDYFHNASTSTGLTSGGGDTILGLKQQLGPIHGFDLSFIPSLSLPTGANQISSHGYDALLQLPWSRALSKNWTAAGQLGVSWPTLSGRHDATGQASLYFDRQLTAPWDAYIEYSGAFPQRGGPQHILDIGSAYKPTPHQQVDLHVYIGLSAPVPDYSVGIGYSVRFQLIRARPLVAQPATLPVP